MALTNSKAHKAIHSNDIYVTVSASPVKTKVLQDSYYQLLLNKKYVHLCAAHFHGFGENEACASSLQLEPST